MTSAYVLIFAVLILGGLIAALGDRIGTKVGKARLRLFNLRPQTNGDCSIYCYRYIDFRFYLGNTIRP